MKIMFSIPVHERPEVVLDQIINYRRFNNDFGIILHFSNNFNWEGAILTEERFFSILENYDNVYINPVRLNTGIYNIIQAHTCNFQYIESRVEFQYFALSSSNELFIKDGLEDYVSQYDIGIQFIDISTIKDWPQMEHALKDRDLNNILSHIKGTKIYGSQLEGTFFKKEIFEKIVDIINKYFDYSEVTDLYAREEIYFPTIAKYVFYDLKITNSPFTYMKWSKQFYGTLIGLYTWNVNNILKTKKNNIFCIKRVDRQFHNYLRTYIRDYIGGYTNEIERFIKGYRKKTIIFIKSTQIIYMIKNNIIEFYRKHLTKLVPRTIVEKAKKIV